MPRAKPTPDAELEAIRRKVGELEDECETLRVTNEELRQSKVLVTEQKQTEELLTATIDSLPEGFLYFDADDRLALVNSRIADIYPLLADVFVLGVSFETCMRTGVERGQWGPDGGQDEEKWIQERLAYHYDPKGTFEFNLSDGRCIRVEEKKTPDGGIVGMRTDITEIKQADRKLEESRELLRALADNLPEFISLKDIEGRFLFVNKRFEEWTGFGQDDVAGKTVHDIYPAEQATRFADDDQKALDSQSIMANELDISYPDGHIRTVVSTRFPITSQVGELIGLGTINFDITERKRAEEELRRAKEKAEAAEELFSKAYHSSPALFTISSPKDSRHIDVNDAWSSITGYSREEALQKTGLELGIWMNPEDRVDFIGQIKKQGIVRNFETVFRTKYGVAKDMLLSGEFIDFRGEDCLLVVGQDITERKEIDRMKQEFISIASHELRTPLTSLKGALDLIHSDVVGQIPEAMAPLLEIAHRNTERLGRLIDDILDMEKLDAGQMEFSMRPMPVPSLIGQAISEHAGYGIKHGVSFVIEGDVPNLAVLGDEDRLMQVFSNLMSNAAKFSPNGTVVRLSACERGQNVRISIKDEGPGIPKEFQEKIFEKFSRADNSDSGQQSGTGLGLSIAKAVVERHGGNLGFKTETDVGTTFFFDLPKADP